MNTNTNRVITISILTSVVIILMFLYLFPAVYFAEEPSEKWWNALSIVVAISFGVIAISLTVLLRERESKSKVKELEQKINNLSKVNTENYTNTLNIISNILDIQNASEIQSKLVWQNVQKNISKIDNIGIIKSLTLRTWSTLAWKQGYLKVTRNLREKAFQLDNKNFRNRVMLCSILTQEEKPDITRIENILNNTDLSSDEITDTNIDHFYNIKGKFYKRIGRFIDASDCFKKAIERNIQTWPFNDYILTLLMRQDVKNSFIREEIDRIASIDNSKWLDDSVLNQKAFRLLVDSFLDKTKIDNFYNYLTPLKIAELANRYDNEYVKLEFFNFFSQIRTKYNDNDLNILYLTYYRMLGVYDKEADIELEKQEIQNEINKRIITAHNML